MSFGHYPMGEAFALLTAPPWIEADRAMMNWGALNNSQIVDD